jgi:trehalose 6-phosphate phosphatase
MTVQLSIAEQLEPLRAEPESAAALFDIDGTLAPIVRHASDANVPEPTRQRLIELAKRYGLVACVSGRAAAVARQIVSIGSMSYLGNHGSELLRAGTTEALVDPEVARWNGRIGAFADTIDTIELRQARVRREDKGAIVAFHWRGAPDEVAALEAIEQIEAAARQGGFETRRGRKVMEVQPPVPFDKGRGIRWLLRDASARTGVYVGDDLTDVDAFAGLRDVLGDGAVCVGVSSDETPQELVEAADAMVDGTGGVVALLGELLR